MQEKIFLLSIPLSILLSLPLIPMHYHYHTGFYHWATMDPGANCKEDNRLYPQKNDFWVEPQVGIESATFWWLVRIKLLRLGLWAKVQVQHICKLSGSHYMLIMILMRYVHTVFKNMGDLRSSEKQFLSPRWELDLQPPDGQWDTLTIELPIKTQMMSQGTSLTCAIKVEATINILLTYYMLIVWY